MSGLVADEIDTVSFDVFDTLVHRAVASPVDLFSAVSLKLASHPFSLKFHDVILGFPVSRSHAEQEARQCRVAEHGGEGEITLDEIYAQFARREKASKECVALLRTTELELEAALIYRSRLGYELYRRVVNAKKRVLFISDMYLPREFLSELLLRLGYELATPEAIFVSGEQRLSKHSGALYSKIKHERNLSPTKWLHVGDNQQSDIAMARKAGLKVMHAHWAKVKNTPTRRTSLSSGFVASLMAGMRLPQYHKEIEHESSYFQLGYHTFGPLLFGYYLWLLRNLETYAADRVLFFARDAQLVMRLHEKMVAGGHVRVNWVHDYVYVSRRSALPLGIVDYPMSRIDHWLPRRSRRNVKDLLSSVGIDAHMVVAEVEREGLTLDRRLGPDDRHRAHVLLNRLGPQILRASVERREELSCYFRKFVEDSHKIAIVDIGWTCNLQSSFARALGKIGLERSVEGFYLGVFDGAGVNLSPYIRAKGWLVDRGEPKERQHALWSGGVELLEFAFTADHGSTVGYMGDKGGGVTPILEEKEALEGEYERCAMELQRGILAFAERNAFLLRQFPLDTLQSLEWSGNPPILSGVHP